jgi:hypothetical protein
VTQEVLVCRGLEEALFDHELEINLNRLIAEHEVEDFSDSKGYQEWLKKSGQVADTARKAMTRKIVETLTTYLSKGLLQVTVEEVMREEEYQDAVRQKKETAFIATLNRDLEPFRVYVDVTSKCGCMDLIKVRYNFKAEPNVTIKDAKIVLQDDRIKSISFGTFVSKLTVSLLLKDTPCKICSIKGSLEMSEPIYL